VLPLSSFFDPVIPPGPENQVSFRSDGRHCADLRTRRIAAFARCVVLARFCTQAWMTLASAAPTCAERPRTSTAMKLDVRCERNFVLSPNMA
jgi:hypothetical protein